MRLIKDVVEKAMSVPKKIEEITSDRSASYLEMDRSIQLDGYSCGVQAAYSILNFYGKARSINNVEKLLGAYERGYASESAIYKLFRERNLRISKRNNATIKTIKESINEYEAPFLTTIDDDEHWIVVYGYSKNNIFVLDSAPVSIDFRKFSVDLKPFVKWSKTKFKNRWDNWGAIIYK